VERREGNRQGSLYHRTLNSKAITRGR